MFSFIYRDESATNKGGVCQFCKESLYLSERQGCTVPFFRTRCYVQDERYFAIEHMDVRRKASLRIRSLPTLHCAKLKEAAPAHPSAPPVKTKPESSY